MNERLMFGPPIDGLLERLYAQNDAQGEALETYHSPPVRPDESFDWNQFDARTNEFLHRQADCA